MARATGLHAHVSGLMITIPTWRGLQFDAVHTNSLKYNVNMHGVNTC